MKADKVLFCIYVINKLSMGIPVLFHMSISDVNCFFMNKIYKIDIYPYLTLVMGEFITKAEKTRWDTYIFQRYPFHFNVNITEWCDPHQTTGFYDGFHKQ